ncbi:MAG: hypothetical protein ACR2PY_01525 [Salinispira sp.]
MYDAIVSLTEELSGLINAITEQQSPLFNGVLWGFIIAFLLNTIGIIISHYLSIRREKHISKINSKQKQLEDASEYVQGLFIEIKDIFNDFTSSVDQEKYRIKISNILREANKYELLLSVQQHKNIIDFYNYAETVISDHEKRDLGKEQQIKKALRKEFYRYKQK